MLMTNHIQFTEKSLLQQNIDYDLSVIDGQLYDLSIPEGRHSQCDLNDNEYVNFKMLVKNLIN